MRTEDGNLIQECLNGKPEAFGILVDKYKAGIYAFVYSELRNFHDAQDVTQDVFLQAYRSLRNLRVWENFSFWLFCIARNLCKKWINNKSRRPDKDFIDDQDSRILDFPSLNSHHENQIFQSLQETMDSLPEDYNQVLVLHYFGGMKIKDIAGTLGVSPTAIGKRLSRARAMLKEEMITMMGTAYEEQRLRSTFTFNIVEIVKRIKIQPTSTMKGLPWGLSFAIGTIITIMSINPALISFEKVGTPIFSPMPAETKVLKVGEIPVDIIKTSNIAFISNNIGKGKGGEPKQPDMQNAFFMAPQGEKGEWAVKTDMPTARVCATAEVNGKIYAIGGTRDFEVTSLSTVEEYDPKTDKWVKKADMPTPRMYLTASAVNRKIYAIGGGALVSLGTVEEYNPETDTWTKKSDMPTPNNLHSAAVVNNKIYIFGGGNGSTITQEYDPLNDKWSKKSDMPTGRWSLGTAVVNNKIYAIGGGVNPGASHSVATVEEYDPATDEWTKKADMPSGRAAMVAVAVNDKIYVIGGGQFDGMTLNLSVNVYDPKTDKWSQESDAPTGRSWLSGCLVDNKIYVIGGQNFGGYLSLLEEYTPEGWSSSISPQSKLPNTWGKLKAK
ncbi:MAG: polymerase sigma factor [Candidatus Poribacteria bacterium]|nr:polymerase sigma factor [Candidatus Poribacteria bacterium]